MDKIEIGGKWKKGALEAERAQLTEASITASKVARIQRELEIDLRQKQARRNTKPEDIRDISIAMEAIDAIKSDKGMIDGKVAGMSGNKYPRILRAKELALRSEVLKGNPDVHKIANMYMMIKGLTRVATDPTLSNTRSKVRSGMVTNEMSVAGIAGADATSQGPLVWGDKGPGIMKTSPFGKVAGKEDSTRKSKTKVDIDSKKINESEFSDDLNAMYGGALKMSDEEKKAKEQAGNYLAGEFAKARERKAEAGRKTNFIIDSLSKSPILEANRPRKVVVNEAKESKVNAAGNYTKPGMRKRIFQRIKGGGKGGDPGQWSARKAQMLAVQYKKAGGGYKN